MSDNIIIKLGENMLDILEEIEKTGDSVTMQHEKADLVFNFNVNEQKETLPNHSSKFSLEEIEKQVGVIILNITDDSFKTKEKPYNLKICGKKMTDWVKNATESFEKIEFEMDCKADFMPLIKSHIMDKKYTLVLFSDAPLIQYKTIQEILEYFVIKSLSVLKLSRGYMFETDYLNRIDKLLSPQMQYFNEEDFITCYSLKQLAIISDIMRNRIISFHQKNGVIIVDSASTFIDADVSIEENVTIFPNNKILGNSIIQKDCVLSTNNLIENSVVMENCKIENSVISQSVISKNCAVINYSVVENKSFLGENCFLKGFNHISGQVLDSDLTLETYEKRE